MKKSIALILALILAFSLIACGGSTATTPDILDSTEIPDTPETPERRDGP